MPKRIAILGSTGSIGCNALEVIEHLGPSYSVAGLSAHSQAEKLTEQALRYRPTAVAVSDSSKFEQVAASLRGVGCTVYSGAGGVAELACGEDVDVVLGAIVGAAGLPPVLAAVRAGKAIALANKESLVVAGSLLMPEAKRMGVSILPVDSEHSAVFQAMVCGKAKEIRRVILTASGGPFRDVPMERMRNATLADALNHPTWRMGNKITIDSATMFNKALEIVEACWLFDLPPERVEVVVHPESVVHSMVEFVDGSVMAQLSPPDMRTPIQFALTYPERAEGISRRLDLTQKFSLNFQPPDPERFPALRIAYDVARRRGTMGAVMNAAKESAVDAFIAGRLSFGMISHVVELTIDRHPFVEEPTLEELLEADRWARATAERIAADC